MTQPANPKLTLIYVARNDNYMGNFRWRFETALNYLADNLVRLNRLSDVEIVVADWGSDEPLHTALTLDPAARRIIRFVIIPPDLARQAQQDSPFPIVIAQNAAIRRSRGEYIAQTDSDVMFTPEFLTQLLKALDDGRAEGVSLDRALIYAKRRHVPWSYVAAAPPIHELDWFMRRFGRLLPVELFVGFEYAGTAMMILHRDVWDECRGYDERLIYWGWMEIDLGLRLKRKYPLFDLRRIGLSAFHLEHYPSRKASNNPRKLNPTNFNNDFNPNGDEWGLVRHSLEVYAYSADTSPLAALAYPTVRFNRRLLNVILRAILIRLWHPIRSSFVVFFIFRRAIHHASVIGGRLRGQSIARWPDIVKAWWVERRRRQ